MLYFRGESVDFFAGELVLADAILGFLELLARFFEILEMYVHLRFGATGFKKVFHPLVQSLTGFGEGAKSRSQAGAVDDIANLFARQGLDGLEFGETEAVQIPEHRPVGATENLFQGADSPGFTIVEGKGDLTPLRPIRACDRHEAAGIGIELKSAAGATPVEGRVVLLVWVAEEHCMDETVEGRLPDLVITLEENETSRKVRDGDVVENAESVHRQLDDSHSSSSSRSRQRSLASPRILQIRSSSSCASPFFARWFCQRSSRALALI